MNQTCRAVSVHTCKRRSALDNYESEGLYFPCQRSQAERESAGIVGAAVLPRNDMFDMEGNQGRRLLRHAAILTRVAGASSNNLP